MVKRVQFHIFIVGLLLAPLLWAGGGRPPKEEPPRSIQKERKIVPKYDPRIFQKTQKQSPKSGKAKTMEPEPPFISCLVWTKQGPPNSVVRDIAVDPERNSYVIGNIGSDIWINKYNWAGDGSPGFPILISGGTGNGIALGSDGFFYMTGTKDRLPWIAKLDPNTANGTLEWEVTSDTTIHSWYWPGGGSTDIVLDPDLNIFVTGQKHGSIWIAKFRENADGTSADLLREIVVPPTGVGLEMILDETERTIYVIGEYAVNKHSLDLDPLWHAHVAEEQSLALDAGILYVGGSWDDGHIYQYNPMTGMRVNLDRFVYRNVGINKILIDGDSMFLTGNKYVHQRGGGWSRLWVAQVDKNSGTIIWEDTTVPADAFRFGGRGLARIGEELYVVGSFDPNTNNPTNPRVKRYYIHKYCPQN